jgi:hypothetical protein
MSESNKYQVLVLFTEGESTEPKFLKEYISYISNYQPFSNMLPQPIVIPIEGNAHNIKEVTKKCKELLSNNKEALEIAEVFGNDGIEYIKYLIVDYDSTTDEQYENLIKDCAQYNYELIVSKPNIEYFILAMLTSVENANNYKKPDYSAQINESVPALPINKIPYDKNNFIAEKFFNSLFIYKPSILKNATELQFDKTNDNWSDIPKLLNDLSDLYKK